MTTRPHPQPDLADLTLHAAAELVRTRQVSPVELARACYARIERLNLQLNAFLTLTTSSALAQARQAEEEIARGQWRGPLHGIPVALKDLVDTAGVRTTAASRVFAERVPERDAAIATSATRPMIRAATTGASACRKAAPSPSAICISATSAS